MDLCCSSSRSLYGLWNELLQVLSSHPTTPQCIKIYHIISNLWLHTKSLSKPTFFKENQTHLQDLHLLLKPPPPHLCSTCPWSSWKIDGLCSLPASFINLMGPMRGSTFQKAGLWSGCLLTYSSTHHGFWTSPPLPSDATSPWREELPPPLPLFITQVMKWLRLCKLCSRPGISPRNLMAAVLIAELCIKFSLRRRQLQTVRVPWAVHSPGTAAWRQRTILWVSIPIPWVLATGSCVQDVPAASQIIHTLLRTKEAEFLSCRCPGKHIHCLYLTHWTHTRSWHISSWKSQIFLLRFASRNSSWSLHKSSLKSPSACCSYPVTGKSPACTNVGALARAMEQVRSKHRGHQHSTLICKDSWIKHVPQIRTSSAQSNDKTYDQLIKWTFISSSCGLSGCETYKMTCSGAVPQVQQWWDRRKKKRMNFSSLNVNLSLLQNIKHLLQIYFPNAALRRKVTSSLTQWVLRFLCWVMSPWLLFYRTGMSVQVPQLWGHHILHKDIKYQPSSISFLVLW